MSALIPNMPVSPSLTSHHDVQQDSRRWKSVKPPQDWCKDIWPPWEAGQRSGGNDSSFNLQAPDMHEAEKLVSKVGPGLNLATSLSQLLKPTQMFKRHGLGRSGVSWLMSISKGLI